MVLDSLCILDVPERVSMLVHPRYTKRAALQPTAKAALQGMLGATSQGHSKSKSLDFI